MIVKRWIVFPTSLVGEENGEFWKKSILCDRERSTGVDIGVNPIERGLVRFSNKYDDRETKEAPYSEGTRIGFQLHHEGDQIKVLRNCHQSLVFIVCFFN